MGRRMKFMKDCNGMILLSYPISQNTPMYGNKNLSEIKPANVIENGCSCNTLNISFSNHTGTHIDCPFHFDSNGKTISDYPEDFWFSDQIELIELNSIPEPGSIIDAKMVLNSLNKPFDKGAKIVILRTGWFQHRNTKKYWKNPPGIHPNVSDYLREVFAEINFFGVDLISISSFSNSMTGKEAHRAFLNHEHPILLIEDMNLKTIPENGIKNLLIAPMFLQNADGAPCTVFGNIGCKA